MANLLLGLVDALKGSMSEQEAVDRALDHSQYVFTFSACMRWNAQARQTAHVILTYYSSVTHISENVDLATTVSARYLSKVGVGARPYTCHPPPAVEHQNVIHVHLHHRS